MAIKTYVTSVNQSEKSGIKVEDTEILTTLGDEEEAISIQLKELFESVTEAIIPNIQSESQLTVEVSGEVSLKAQGGIKYLFFNVGGETGSKGAMKVTLTTTLKPKTR